MKHVYLFNARHWLDVNPEKGEKLLKQCKWHDTLYQDILNPAGIYHLTWLAHMSNISLPL